MSIKLKKVEKRQLVPVFDVVYTIRHDGEKTSLEQDLSLEIYQSDTGISIKGHMDMKGIEVKDIESAMDKMAEWCERMSIELRKERSVDGVIPIM